MLVNIGALSENLLVSNGIMNDCRKFISIKENSLVCYQTQSIIKCDHTSDGRLSFSSSEVASSVVWLEERTLL